MSFAAKETEERIRTICLGIREVYESYRKNNRWVNYQDAWGLVIFLAAISAIVTSFVFWWNGMLPAWITILSIAFFTSFLHELEHDLIHELYFKKIPLIYHAMLFGVWIFRPLTLNPWIRKYWHHFHHQHSGSLVDIEERGVTNGEKWGLLRLIILPDLLLGFLFRFPRLKKEISKEFKEGRMQPSAMKMLKKTILLGMMPFGIPLHLVWYVFVLLKVMQFLGINPYPNLQEIFFQVSTPLMVGLIAPNLIRQFCLHFITSNMHYFGDIEHGNVLEQTQVLNAWWTLPFHLFCFNFGSTHAIHHFVVNEPFYLRQLTAKRALDILKNNGIRFNDYGSFRRANRYHS
jgi:fatty acid desaturase